MYFIFYVYSVYMAKGTAKRTAKGNRTSKGNRKRSSNKSRKNSKKMKGGDCGCQQKGGFGAQSLQPIPIRYYYAGNTYDSDPNNPAAIVSGRNYMAGGQRMGQRMGKRMSKRMRGGVSADPILGAGNTNLSFGTTPGAFSGASVFHANTVENPSPTANPVLGWKSSSYV